VQCGLRVVFSILFFGSGCSRRQARPLCVGVVSRRSQVAQGVPSGRSFASSFSLSSALGARSGSSRWAWGSVIASSAGARAGTGSLGRSDVTLGGLAVERFFEVAATDAPSLDSYFSG